MAGYFAIYETLENGDDVYWNLSELKAIVTTTTAPTYKTVSETAMPVNLLNSEAFRQYVATALWSTTDDDGTPLDANYDFDDVDPESLSMHRSECEGFIQVNYEVIVGLLEFGYEMTTIMHDFWLTRNGHGCGFWEDGNYPQDIGVILTDSAHSFGERNPYVGDDGQLYLS
jgi:hypothetical protein